MGIYYDKHSRRQFLVGTGKSLLALPLLPSLLPRSAFAQASGSEAPRRLMMFYFDHNNIAQMWPALSHANQNIGNDGFKETMLSSIGSVANHSPALSHSLFQSLQNNNLLTYVRGLDVPAGGGHGNGVFAAGEGEKSEGGFPTIESVIEASKSVYPVGTSTQVTKAIRINLGIGNLGYYKENGSGGVDKLSAYNKDLQKMYQDLFSELTGGSVPPQDTTNLTRSNILNRVHESYGRFMNSSRISQEDRQRLEQHMDIISDLQRTFASAPINNITCSKPTDPGNFSFVGNEGAYTRAYIDMLAVAFKCGITKCAAMGFNRDANWVPGVNSEGLSFHDIMHGVSNQASRLQTPAKTRWWQYHADLVADRFLTPLQEMEGDTGRSYLDNMLTAILCGGGCINAGSKGTHHGNDTHQILIGSMGGRLRSGRFMTVPRASQNVGRRGNLPHNTFLITLLQLMGVPKSEYETTTPNNKGFGSYKRVLADDWYDWLSHRFYGPITELLT